MGVLAAHDPEKRARDLIEGGKRFSEMIMRKNNVATA
jgi:hypothetical protein